jgi:uncharacterized protein (UPF0128 family)
MAIQSVFLRSVSSIAIHSSGFGRIQQQMFPKVKQKRGRFQKRPHIVRKCTRLAGGCQGV